jgi:NTE family protein
MADLHFSLGDGLGAAALSSALARLFIGERASPEVVWFSLPGGRTLFSAGEASELLYFVRAGRLAAFRKDSEGSHYLGVIKPGEPVGEMAMVADTPHSATVVAVRDSEILALPRRAFFAAARRDPGLMAELARLMIVRARQPASRPGSAIPRVLGFIAGSEGPPIRPFIEQIGTALTALRCSVAVIGKEAEQAPTEWFSTVEQRHDFVLFVAERGEAGWASLCARQVDRLIIVGRGADPPPDKPAAFAGDTVHENRLIDLILIHPERAERPSGVRRWLEAGPFARHLNIREGSDRDAQRLARMLCGASVGLVLSGGGARAYAHIGAIRALHEQGVPIDFIGGTSMGAIIGAGVAMGWPDEEIVRRIRRSFVDSSPLADIAFPMIAMTQGHIMRQRLAENFEDVEIEDLWLPFYCVSSNLTSGEYKVHDRGSLRTALRASAALPGIVPPMVMDGSVLVDGAVTNNLPVDVMRRLHRGAVVGVDVAEEGELRPDEIESPPSLWRFIASGQWRRGPPIVGVLIRAATVSSARSAEELARHTDLVIAPMIDGVGVQDWKMFDVAVEAGYQATIAGLKTLKRPLTELHEMEMDLDPIGPEG